MEIFQRLRPALFNTILVAVIGTLGNVFVQRSPLRLLPHPFSGPQRAVHPAADGADDAIEVIIIPLFYEMIFNLTDSLIPLMLIPIFCSWARFPRSCSASSSSPCPRSWKKRRGWTG
ncbi:MAG: hypothetical protein ACLTBF_06515 [Christensenellales bacterium]